jgi:hypothetical protein
MNTYNDQEQSSENESQLTNSLPCRVECYCGYRAEESPRRFFIGKRAINLVEIVDRWLDPKRRYFKVRGDDGGIYILRYDVKLYRWEMIMFDSDTRAETRLSST